MNALSALIKRDMRVAVRAGGGALMGALFFLIMVVMVPFAVGPDLKLLALIGPAMLWLGALLASLLLRAPDAALLSRLSELRGDASPLGLAHVALADAAQFA